MYNHKGSEYDWSQHYSSIGEFVVVFESIVENIRFQLSAIFQIRGLNDWKISEIVFGQKQFTADPLITCFESVTYELFKNKTDSKDLLTSITKFKNKFKRQIEIRNDLLHSFYLIGPNIDTISTDSNPPDDLVAIKTSPTKDGARKKEVVKSIEELKTHITELMELRNDFISISSKLIIIAHQNNMMIGFKKINKKTD